MGVPENEEKEYSIEQNIWRNSSWKFPNMVKDRHVKIQEAQ